MNNIDDLSRIRFNKNYLQNVIFRLDFSPILSLKKELSAKFQEALREEFPTLEPQPVIEHTIETKDTVDDRITNFLNYNLFDKNKETKLTISYKYLILDCLKYSNFTNFKSTVNKICSVFTNCYDPLDYKRLGLRYINNITFKEGNPLEWSDFINQTLIATIENFFGNKNEIARAMTQMVMNKSDFKLVFTFGIFNPEFPSPISRKEFILDYDCFTNDIEQNNIIFTLEKFNTEILNLFLKSISEKLKNLMNTTGD